MMLPGCSHLCALGYLTSLVCPWVGLGQGWEAVS